MTGETPAKLMFGRNIRDKIPTARNDDQTDADVMDHDNVKKAQMKIYTDQKCKAKHHSLKPGELVLVKNPACHRNKFTPPWFAKPLMITSIRGN